MLKLLSFARLRNYLMSHGLRCWLYAVTIMLLAEDFQYVLKIGDSVWAPAKSELTTGCEDCDENEDGTNEKEEKKDEKKEKDDDNKLYPEDFLYAGALLAKNKFIDVFAPLSAIAHDLECPPPEV